MNGRLEEVAATMRDVQCVRPVTGGRSGMHSGGVQVVRGPFEHMMPPSLRLSGAELGRSRAVRSRF